ncbi:Fe-S protein assembly chaperone HscA [bacterium]|nr:Fe-S protein assembly chaperone HscA [bacterium]
MSSGSLTILRSGGSDASPESILGIDLGTTFSLAAYMENGRPKLVRDEAGDARVPSVIHFSTDGSVVVGAQARAQWVADPTHTPYSIKRLIGRTLADVQKDLAFVPYQIVERPSSDGRSVLHVRIENQEHTPEILSSMILREVVRRADRQAQRRFRKAVITVPAYFDETQRQATRDAGRLAGLDVVRIINEPTAAALAYGLESRHEGLVAVYDFGGGTFDCSILRIESGVFKVLSTHGDTHLGGDDVDRLLMEATCAQQNQILASLEPSLKQKLRDACEQLKIDLSDKTSATLHVELVPGEAWQQEWSREDLNNLINPVIERTMASCKSALRDAALRAEEIDEVVMVGGSSRIPLVRERVEKLFGRRPHTEINPDEVVAAGAAVQGSILSGATEQVLLLDITPLSLGIETMGGAVSRLIGRNSTIPVQATERFTTFADNQTGVDIHILQGERELVKDCRSLGRFRLSGLSPMPAGLPQIDVTFLLDANGMLQVSARELRSDQQASIEIRPSSGLTRDEVERMIRDSIENASEDFAARRIIELRNKAVTNLRATDKGLRDAADRLDSPARTAISMAMDRVRAVAAAGEDPDELQRALDSLDEATRGLAAMLLDSVAAAEVTGKRVEDAR